MEQVWFYSLLYLMGLLLAVRIVCDTREFLKPALAFLTVVGELSSAYLPQPWFLITLVLSAMSAHIVLAAAIRENLPSLRAGWRRGRGRPFRVPPGARHGPPRHLMPDDEPAERQRQDELG